MCSFMGCENALTGKCSGEVRLLLLAAERYGGMTEAARERVEAICRQCRNYLSPVQDGTGYAKDPAARDRLSPKHRPHRTSL